PRKSGLDSGLLHHGLVQPAGVFGLADQAPEALITGIAKEEGRRVPDQMGQAAAGPGGPSPGEPAGIQPAARFDQALHTVGRIAVVARQQFVRALTFEHDRQALLAGSPEDAILGIDAGTAKRFSL